MYSRGGNAYGQQSYAAQSGYGQKEPDVGGYRSHPSATSSYAGQYSAMYGSTAIGGSHSQQIHAIGSKAYGSCVLESRGGYSSALGDSPKFGSGEYLPSSNLGYGRKNEALYEERLRDYAIEKRQYVERQGAFLGTDLHAEQTKRFADSVGFSLPREVDAYDPIEPALLLRQEQILKPQSYQSNSLDGTRRTEYLAARGAVSHHTPQELLSYGGRLDADPDNFSVRGASSYTVADAPSILGAPPRKDVDNVLYGQSSSNPGYGVSLPPGRDYSLGKGRHGSTLESDYSDSVSRGNHSRNVDFKDDRASYLREFELREEERRRERIREREKEREREGRERLRERERDREMLERREKERERDRRRALEVRRERTPQRTSRDRRASSLAKERRSQQRDSPHQESSHRPHSPVKEIRRDYVCKVYTSSLITVDRDFLSVDKRYPKLYVSPEFSKVVVHWPKENLKLPLRTPVSFEHDFVEDENATESNSSLAKVSSEEPSNLEKQSIVWNAKVILMSGLSRTAREDICSSKSFGDRYPHICNILRFGVLKKGHSLMAIGGPWKSIDGNDPSIDDSSLIKTAIRHTKDVTQLDLQNCQKWNRFLEIHYDRIGKDGLFSHKEVTVLFVPDLAECLPSLEAWRDQWLLHMKAVAERERNISMKKEKPGQKREGHKEKDTDSVKAEKNASRLEKKESAVGSKTERKADPKKEDNAAETSAGPKDDAEKGKEAAATGAQSAETVKSGKKKIVRKIVKKVANKTSTTEDPDSKLNDKINEKDGEKVGSGDAAVGQNSGVKTTVKRKVIKKVLKKKVNSGDVNAGVVDSTKGGGEKNVDGEGNMEKPGVDEVHKSTEKVMSETSATVDEQDKTSSSVKTEVVEKKDMKVGTGVGEKRPSNKSAKAVKEKKPQKDATDVKKLKEGEKLNEVDKKETIRKDESRNKLDKETAKGKNEEPPRPGFILQTKCSKDAKLRSTDLSLDSLLDYTDRDVEESAFELSLFAESLYEMLQYEMGCRILTFLQKLRVKFITKRNQRKRRREETQESESDGKSSAKLPKSSESAVKAKSTTEEISSAVQQNDEKMDEEDAPTEHADDAKMDENEDSEEPEEEDPEECEDLEDETPQDESIDEKSDKKEITDGGVGPENSGGNKDGAGEQGSDKSKVASAELKPKTTVDTIPGKKEEKVEGGSKQDCVVKVDTIDKELLQAFRFFDRNRVGYLRVEDMRLIIHNLGKFLSHRDVKELVQSALLESNTGRDDRVIYDILVKMAADL